MSNSFLLARCEEPLSTNDWGLPLLLALIVLALVYAFLYLPAMAQQALLEQALNGSATAPATPMPGRDD